jgi:hypothetical protein
MAWTPMSEEEADEVIDSGPPDTAMLSAEEARRLREAQLVKMRDLSEDEIRAELEAAFGPLD